MKGEKMLKRFPLPHFLVVDHLIIWHLTIYTMDLVRSVAGDSGGYVIHQPIYHSWLVSAPNVIEQ